MAPKNITGRHGTWRARVGNVGDVAGVRPTRRARVGDVAGVRPTPRARNSKTPLLDPESDFYNPARYILRVKKLPQFFRKIPSN